MAAWEITSLEYDVPLERLMARRLKEAGGAATIEPVEDGVCVRMVGEDALLYLSEATARLLLRDLQYLVLARMTDATPLSLAEKRTVLTDALAAARSHEDRAPLRNALIAHFADEHALCLDGFLSFRMQDVLMLWQLCVEQAAGKVLLEKEYGELMESLRAFVATQRARTGVIRLCIHPDGSCTLSDDDRLCIEYADASPEGIVTLLVNMAPRRLLVFDQSRGAQSHLCETLLSVFSDRAEVRRE